MLCSASWLGLRVIVSNTRIGSFLARKVGRRAIWRIMLVLSEILLVLNEILRNHAFGGTADVVPRAFAVACVDTLPKGVD